LIFLGYKVKFVQNFTDIDDKIINRAKDENTDYSKISERFIDEYIVDSKNLNILPADIYPKATETIEEIICIISELVLNNYAYLAPSGDVYFDTKTFRDYGKLSGQQTEELVFDVRKKISKEKHNSLDFVLWKSSKKDEPKWHSPWGYGRPGWHIECSAMIRKYLGKTIDIHCGGQDLIFPHHENEIAQSECANGICLSNFWLHNGFININNEKMSKSLNNFLTVREVAEKYGYKSIRYLLVSAHYRSPLNLNEETMLQCKNAVARLAEFKSNLEFILKNQVLDNGQIIFDDQNKSKQKFLDFMNDDLNTAGAISVIFEIIRNVNTKITESKQFSENSVLNLINLFDELTSVLGLSFKENKNQISDEIQKLINKREAARKEQNWALADEIREILKNKGVLVEDKISGSKTIIN
jgi:cysteinyl-tRNA synthetase